METPEVIRVLLFDDDDEQLRILGRLLSRRGFSVATTSSPSALIDEAIRFNPALILFDVQMPTISSGELLTMLRGHTELQGARVLLFSACDTQLLRRLSQETGADGWLQKTFDGDHLAQRLREILSGP
jgi:two-component system, OmpR family, response regulator